MIIDTHCHFDMLPNPEQFIQKEEASGNIIIGMTNLPSHFQMGFPHLRGFRHIRLALGLHPLLAEEHIHELPTFKRLIDYTSYIGEIGLDFSKEGIGSKDIQTKCFESILTMLEDKNKIISIHSRGAEEEVVSLLRKHRIRNVIFHWYSGKLSLIPQIVEMGYYFSVNEAMTLCESGRKVIAKIPQERLLTESDAPFNRKNSILNAMREIPNAENSIKENFNTLLLRLK